MNSITMTFVLILPCLFLGKQGPLETDMVEEIRANMERIDVSLQPSYRERVLDPMDSARKLLRLLHKNDFESGVHIDFYDLPDQGSS